MSQIDEAFIQAYATAHQPLNAPGVGQVPVVSQRPPLAGLHVGPHIHLPPAPPQPPATPTTTRHTIPPIAPATPLVAATPTVGQPSVADPYVAPPQVAWKPEPLPSPHFRSADNDQTDYVAPAAQTAEAVAPVEPSSKRRPLSTFSAPEQPATTAFNPVFEVDKFRWPKITEDLLNAHHELLIPVVGQLLDISEQGRSLVGIVGTRTNIGCSTLLICLARLIAGTGKSVALVDANFSKASLAHDLGLEFDTGWENVLAGELPLAECVVKSLQDPIALLPLARQQTSPSELLASIQTSITAGVLRYHYDVVLFNMGAAAESVQGQAALSIMQHCRLDAGIIVADTERYGIDPMDTLMSLFGPTCLGVIGNSAA